MTRRPLNGGVYALFLRVPTRRTVRIGQLVNREFPAGIYVYVGSARNSLSGRISRHLRHAKKKHWHIDYLLDGVIARPSGVAWKPTRRRIECSVSRNVGSSASMSVEGFGCSDCDCVSHLHHFPRFHQAFRALSQLGFHFSTTSGLLKNHFSDFKGLKPISRPQG